MILGGRTLFNNTRMEIVLDAGRVQSCREFGISDTGGTPDTNSTNDTNIWIAPALIDIQVNGFAGFDLNVDAVTAGDVSAMLGALWRVGTGFVCPTVVTGSFTGIRNTLRAIVAACEADRLVDHAVLGIHLEGPYISDADGPRGAHPLAHVRDPAWDEFQRWQEAADGRITLVTLAPERTGALRFIEQLVAAGITVALGHTAASSETIHAAIAAGARLSTHLGNGAHAHLPRHPNYIWEQLGADALWASFIVDGHHLPSPVAKSMLRAKTPQRSLLVSDAVALAGMPPGTYHFAGRAVELTADRCVRLVGTEYLAGSAIELARGVENCVRFAGLSLREAVALATVQPMHLLNAQKRVETHTNLIRFTWDAARAELHLLATIIGDELVYHAEAER